MEGNKKTIERILSSSDRGVSEIPFTEGGVLARIFRRFLLLNVNAPMTFYRLMREYVKQVESGEAGLRTDMVSVKGNTTKVLSRNEFTWKNFITAMRFLQTRELRIIVERTDRSGNVQRIEEVIKLNQKPSIHDFEDESEPVETVETEQKDKEV